MADDWKGLTPRGRLTATIATGLVLVAVVAFLVWALQQPAPHDVAGTNWDAYVALLTNLPHILLELTIEAITAIAVYPFARWVWDRWHAEHDAEHHPPHVDPMILPSDVFRPGHQIVVMSRDGAQTLAIYSVNWANSGHITLQDISPYPPPSVPDNHPVA